MKKRDIIIIAALLVVGVVSFALVNLFGAQKGDVGYVYISVGTKLYEAHALDENVVVTVDQGSDVVNHIEIKDGVVRMLDSTCPDKQCVHQGEMSRDNINEQILRNFIICQPNLVTVELRLKDEG